MESAKYNELIQQIETLQKENADWQLRYQGENIKVYRLLEHILKNSAQEMEMRILEAETSALKRNAEAKEENYRNILLQLKEQLLSSGNPHSSQLAKLSMLMDNPELIGAKSRCGVLAKIISARLRGQDILSGFMPAGDAISFIDNALNSPFELNTENSGCEASQQWSGDQTKLISIVLPVYNQADMVHESIESVINQTYTNWELIIINDGSTDNLAEAAAPYLADKRIHYFEQANQRLPKALSNGFSFASGELVTWTSADNNMRPMMLARLADFLNTHPDVDMVYADYMAIDDKGEPFTEEWFRPHNKLSPTSPLLKLPRTTALLNIIQDNFIGASFMYRKSTLKTIKDYDPQLGVEDYDYWMRINNLFNIAHIGTDETLYDYRVHDNTLNARAAEFKIQEKVFNLMEYEKERFCFYYQPFHIYGSYKAEDFVPSNFQVQYCGAHIQGDIPSHRAYKNILIVSGDQLSTYAFDELKKYDYIAAFFAPGQANEAGKCAFYIRHFNIMCLAYPESAEYRRLDMLTGNLHASQPQQLVINVTKAANNDIFLKKTRSPEEMYRKLPVMPEKSAGRIIVMLEQIGNGGMEQVAYDMFTSFRKAGKDVLFVCMKRIGDGVNVPQNIPVIELDNSAEEFCKLLDEQPCDAVFSHYCLAGAKETSDRGIPFFQILHNSYVWFDDAAKEAYRQNDCYTSAYIAVSANVAWYSCECIGIPEEKIIIIENGIVPERFIPSESVRKEVRRQFGFTDSNFVLLNPASCYGTKGQLILIQAFAVAYRQNPDLRLILAGKIFEDHYYQSIANYIRDNRLEHAVIHGKFYDNMDELYNSCDAVVLASFWEGCSLTVAEAIRMKKPLIATKVGDIERQTAYNNVLLYDIPFRYLTDLGVHNYGSTLYTPPESLIYTLSDNLLRAAKGEFPATGESVVEQGAEEVYQRYLALLNYFKGNISIQVIRHNI